MALVESKFFETKVVPISCNNGAGGASAFAICYPNIGSNPKQIEFSFMFACDTPNPAQLIFVRYNGKIIGSAWSNSAAVGISQKYISSDPNFFNGSAQLEFVNATGTPVPLLGSGVLYATYFR